MLRVLALCCNAVLVSVMALGSLGRADIQRGYEFGMEFGAQEKVSSAEEKTAVTFTGGDELLSRLAL